MGVANYSLAILLLAAVKDEGGGNITLLLLPPKEGDELAKFDLMMGLAGSAEWLAANGTKVEAMKQWMAAKDQR